MLLFLPILENLKRLADPHSLADIVLVFLIIYGVLKLVRV